MALLAVLVCICMLWPIHEFEFCVCPKHAENFHLLRQICACFWPCKLFEVIYMQTMQADL